MELSCSKFISEIENLAGKEIRFMGSGHSSFLTSMSFILMALGCKQVKFYPHLITLIKEQFFRPGMFQHYDTGLRNRVLDVCRNLEI